MSDDARLAAHIAEVAGKILLTLQTSGLAEGKELGAVGDEVANAFIMRILRQKRPDDGLLSEEEVSNPARLKSKRVWIIDPLDGTREFSEGRTDWAVHVALAIDGVPAASSVALPGLGLNLSSLDVPRFPAAENTPLRMMVSRSRPPEIAVKVAKQLKADLVPMGSAGAKAMAVVRGEGDIYLHSGGQYEWDSAAPVGVAAAAGLHVSRIDGSPFQYNQADPYLPDLLICRPELAADILAMIR